MWRNPNRGTLRRVIKTSEANSGYGNPVCPPPSQDCITYQRIHSTSNTMVYKFKLVSDEVSNFAREIEIDSESTFLQLRNAILESVDFSKDELDSFFLCEDDWSKQEEITLEDMGSSSDQDIWLMEETPIGELVEDEGQKMIFEFDYMTERCFFMELKEIQPGRSLVEPVCIFKKGKAPIQFQDTDDFEVKIDPTIADPLKDELDIDFYGDTDFNEDELADFSDDLNLN